MAAAPGRFAWLRERFTDRSSLLTWSIIANDGIIATAGLLEGFAGAGADDRVLLLAATAATIAGMLAVGGVEWMEASVEREAQLSLVAEEQREIDADPERELADLIERAYFCRCTSRFVDSVLTFRERKGYITGRQERALRAAVGSLERGM